MKNKKYEQFVSRWNEVMDLPEQHLGSFTPLYHKMVRLLKVMPVPLLFFAGVCIALVLVIIFGSAIIRLVSLLQRGF